MKDEIGNRFFIQFACPIFRKGEEASVALLCSQKEPDLITTFHSRQKEVKGTHSKIFDTAGELISLMIKALLKQENQLDKED